MSISILVLRDRVSRLVLRLWVGFCGGCPVEGRDVERITSFPVISVDWARDDLESLNVSCSDLCSSCCCDLRSLDANNSFGLFF